MGFHAVFIGTGAGYPAMLGIPGDSLNGVLSANELLTRCNLMHARDFPNFDTPHARSGAASRSSAPATRPWTRCACACGSAPSRSTASTAARARKRPARAEEVHHAEEEGIEFHWLTNPVEVLDDGQGSVRAHPLRAHGARRTR